MTTSDDDVVVVEEEVIVTTIPTTSPQPKQTSGIPWTGFAIISVLVGILSFVLVWLPMQRQNKLWGKSTNDTITHVGGDVCQRVSGPPFCNDVVMDSKSGLAFLACDPFKPSFYPPYELYNASSVYGNGGIWLYDTNDPKSPPTKLSFQENASPPHGFHPTSLTISPVEQKLSAEQEAGERIIRLLVVSYPEDIDNGVVEVIDYHLPPTSFLTNLFGIKHTERGGELSYVATIESTYFTAPAGIVAVKDQPSLLSEFDSHSIPSFYLTNTYRAKGWMRTVVEKGLQIMRGDLVFYNAKAKGALRVGFGLDRPGAVATDDTDSGLRVYVSTQDGLVHLFEQFYIDSSGKQLSTQPVEDRELQLQSLTNPSGAEDIQVFHPTFMQTSHFATNFPVVGLAALSPAPNALGGDIFVIGSPKHYLFVDALRNESAETVPVSLLRLKPFYYVFNKTIAAPDKVYFDDDPRLKTGTRNNRDGTPDRKRWWEATTIWTGPDFGAGPGSIAVKETNKHVVVLGVGGGKKGGLLICSVELSRREVTAASGTVR